MKVMETLSAQSKRELIEGEAVGIFTYLILNSDPFYNERNNMCLTYYFHRSGSKTLSPTYTNLLNFITTNSLPTSADESVARIIRSKYINKWSRVYDALITQDYGVLDVYDFTEHKIGDNTDTTTYNSSVEDNGNSSTDVINTVDEEGYDDVYGFNSAYPAGDRVNTSKTTDRTTSDKDKNTTHNKRDKSGNDNTQYDINETISRTGRDKIGAELIERELDFRERNIFYDIVLSDIDSVMALQIYS